VALADAFFGISAADIEGLVAEPLSFTGTAVDQVAAVVLRVAGIVAVHTEAAQYRPGDIL
jgi:adenylosuccinate lyase